MGRQLGTAQRVALVVGLAAALFALSRYVETLGRRDITFGWFAYSPLSRSGDVPRVGLRTSLRDLGTAAAAVLVWAAAAYALIRSAFGRRIVLVVASAGVLLAVGRYVTSLGNGAGGPGVQFLSSEQLTQLPGGMATWARWLVWTALAAVWTALAMVLLRRRPQSDG